MKKTVLVTGAAGFLGSHLCKHHLELGDQVFGIDNFCSSRRTSAHLRELQTYPNFNLMEEDICDEASWRVWQRFDVIYNFACPASPPIYQSIPIETMMACTIGVVNMLQLAMRSNAVLVHASTSEVYGDPDISPQHEGYRGNVNSYGPRACYDEGKRAAEALCYDFRHKHGVDARMVRVFNTYGPNMDANDGRVVSNFICQALRGEKLTVYGNGMQGRSFCYVNDLIRGIVALGELGTNPGTPINLGNPNEFTVLSLAQKVIKRVYGGNAICLGDEHMIEMKPLPTDDPTQRCPDINLARMHLDWEPKVSLDEGLDRTVMYFTETLRHE